MMRLSATCLLVLVWCCALHADALAQTDVVARINGRDIKQSELELARAELGPMLSSMGADEARLLLVGYLVELELFASAAEERKVAEDPSFVAELAYLRRRLLKARYVQGLSSQEELEGEARRIYGLEIAQIARTEEIQVSHILVDTEARAKELHKAIAEGSDFAKLAEQSLDAGTSWRGGALGYVSREELEPEFADVAFPLALNTLSAPVKTRFGWHLIRVSEKRMRPAPSFEALKANIVSQLATRRVAEEAERLRASANVEIVDKAFLAAADALRSRVQAEAGVAAGVASEFRYAGMKVTLTRNAEEFVLHFGEASPEMERKGITNGAEFVRVSKSGNEVVGTAMAFFPKCPPVSYGVKGAFNSEGNALELQGEAPMLDANCLTVGSTSQRLSLLPAP